VQRDCRFCAAAAALLTRRGIDFDVIDLTDDEPGRRELAVRTGLATLPQFFSDGELVGGFDALLKLDRSGKLVARRKTSPSAVTHDSGGA
jgi:glutaredoxin 3